MTNSNFALCLSSAALLLGCPDASAVTPLTPHLTKESRQELLMRLDEAGFPEVGQNSVLIALAGTLGSGASDNAYSYDMPYPQLPKVEGRSVPSPTLPGCATVVLVASYAAPATPMRIHLRGIYCLVGPAEWQAREQVLGKT